MNKSKFLELFDPSEIKDTIHIIGCGSVGSTIAELLARYGLTKFKLYDFDIVEPKNIGNQMFRDADIGKLKTEALKSILVEINPECEKTITLEKEGWQGQQLTGYVFLAVDKIALRKEICESNKLNRYINAMFDVRTGLYDAETRAANWKDRKHIQNFINSMQYSSSDVQKTTPRSACGVEFGVAATIRLVSTVCVLNFLNFIQKNELNTYIITGTENLDCAVSILA